MRPLLLLVPFLLAPLAAAQGTGTLAGRVTDATTGAPISAARVHAERAGATHEAATDAEGYFRFPAVPAGTYTVTARGWAHSPVTREVSVGAKHKAALALPSAVVVEYELPIISVCGIGSPFVLADEARAAALALLRAPGGILSGRVTDAATGEGLPGANVVLVGTRLGAATDLDGRYTIIGIPAGTYDVTAAFVGFEVEVAEEVVVRAGYTTAQDFALEEDASIVYDVCCSRHVRPFVPRDPFAARVVTGEEIARMPVNR